MEYTGVNYTKVYAKKLPLKTELKIYGNLLKGLSTTV